MLEANVREAVKFGIDTDFILFAGPVLHISSGFEPFAAKTNHTRETIL
jgi:hypothetical protein